MFEQANDPSRPARRPGGIVQPALRILLIEPDGARRRALSALLRGWGRVERVEEARGFLEGLRSLRVDRWSCVLVARELPDGDSLAFVGLVRNTEASATPLLFLLDDEDEDFESQAMEAGAEDTILREDATERGLPRAMRAAIARSGLQGELARANARLERIAVNDGRAGRCGQ